MPVIVRFFSPSRDEEGPKLGPFAWLQVTYDELRMAPEGDTLAVLNEHGWHLRVKREPIGGGWVSVTPDESAPAWSDFVISAAEEKGA